MRYEIYVQFHTARAVNKATIYDSGGKKDWFVCDAANDEQAWKLVCAAVSPYDKKPIAGKSYLRQCRVPVENRHVDGRCAYNDLPTYKVGDRVIIHEPHNDHPTRTGVISGGGANLYEINIDGYHTTADFTIRQFAHENPKLT